MHMKMFPVCTMQCSLDWPYIQITVTKIHTLQGTLPELGPKVFPAAVGNEDILLGIWQCESWRTHMCTLHTPRTYTQYSMYINLTLSTTFNHMCTTHFRLSSPSANTDKDINSCRFHRSDVSGLSRSLRYPLTASQLHKSQPTNLIMAFSSQDQQETE